MNIPRTLFPTEPFYKVHGPCPVGCEGSSNTIPYPTGRWYFLNKCYMRAYLNTAVMAAGGLNGIKREYSLSPASINRILNSVESQMTGRVNRNIETLMTAIARAESQRLNSLMSRMQVATKKRVLHKRPLIVRKARKTGLTNMAGMLNALPVIIQTRKVTATKKRKPLGVMVKPARFKK